MARFKSLVRLASWTASVHVMVRLMAELTGDGVLVTGVDEVAVAALKLCVSLP